MPAIYRTRVTGSQRAGGLKGVEIIVSKVDFSRQINKGISDYEKDSLDAVYTKRVQTRYKEAHNETAKGIGDILRSRTGYFPNPESGGVFKLSFYSNVSGAKREFTTKPFQALTEKYRTRRPKSVRFWRKKGDLSKIWDIEAKPIRSRRARVGKMKATRAGYEFVKRLEFYGWSDPLMQFVSGPLVTGELGPAYLPGMPGHDAARNSIYRIAYLEGGVKSINMPPRPFIRGFSAKIGQDLRQSLQRL